MHVIDPIGEAANELDGVDPLPNQVAGIEVEAKLLTMPDRFERSFGTVKVEGNFSRVNFQRETDAALGEDVENRIPTIGELLVTVVNHLLRHRRERVEQVPDARAGEPVDR